MKTKEDFIKKILNFDNYHDFSDGVNINDGELKTWIRKAIDRAVKKIKEKSLDESFGSIASGNGHIFVEVYYNKNDDTYTVHVNVTRNYKNCNDYGVTL